MHTDSRRQPKLRDQFRNAIRVRHYRVRTEKAYWYWIRYFTRFNRMRHPSEITEPQVSAFLTWLATERDAAAATQTQALNALVLLYRQQPFQTRYRPAQHPAHSSPCTSEHP